MYKQSGCSFLFLGIRQALDGVAFTAYLDHFLDNLGKDQPIVYNQVLLNDGGSYSVNTGKCTGACHVITRRCNLDVRYKFNTHKSKTMTKVYTRKLYTTAAHMRSLF